MRVFGWRLLVGLYAFVLVFCTAWVVGGTLAVISIFSDPENRHFWPLAILFLIAIYIVAFKVIPSFSNLFVREVFGRYSVRISGSNIEIKCANRFGETLFSVPARSLRIENQGILKTPLCLTGNKMRSLVFGALFTRANWESLRKVRLEAYMNG